MKKLFARVALPLSIVVLCTAANADSLIVEVWTCQLNDGQSLDDAKAENANWLEFVNGSVAGGGVVSHIATPIVGAQGQFMYIDTFPSMEAWTAMKEAIATDEGQVIEEALGTIATCESNSLFHSEQT